MVFSPGPPRSSGIIIPPQPLSPNFRIASAGKRSSRSHSFTNGRTSASMNCRTVSRISFWWSLRPKSIRQLLSRRSTSWTIATENWRYLALLHLGSELLLRCTLKLQLKQFPQSFRLLPAHGNICLFLVIHFDHETGLEPRHNLFDVMNIHQIRAMRP